MTIPFRKMHGLGNDFAIFDLRQGGEVLPPDRLQALSSRNRGIGFDQVIFMLPGRAGTDIYLDMYNADGSPLEACGNATRCVARILFDETGADNCVIETIAGKLHARTMPDHMIQIDMGVPRTDWQSIPLSQDRDTLHLQVLPDMPAAACVNVGNPHAVFFVDDVTKINLSEIGPIIEHHNLFPQRVNVEFAQIISPQKIRMRVWERGTGITEACGTGACATIVAAVRRNLDRKAEIILDGGSLFLEWREGDNHILMTGPAAYVYEGVIAQ